MVDGLLLCKHSTDSVRPCGFAAHKKCWEVHEEVVSCDGSRSFSCSNVTHQFRPKVVAHLAGRNVDRRLDKLRDLEKAGRLKKSVDKRKRRLVVNSTICKMCGDSVPFAQRAHLMHHCRALTATPPGPDKVRNWRAFSKRCFEIANKRFKPNQIQVSRIRDGIDYPAWGSRAGQSLRETTPEASK